MMVDLKSVNDVLHLSQLNMAAYAQSNFPLSILARRLKVVVQLGTMKLSRWRHWLKFIKTNGAAPRAAKSALQRSRLYWQLHQLWKSFELHERSKLDELARAVMTGRVLLSFTTFSFQSFLCFIGSFAQPWTVAQLSRSLNTSIKQRLEDTTTLQFVVATPNSSHSEHFDLRRTNHNRGKMKEKENKNTSECGLFQLG